MRTKKQVYNNYEKGYLRIDIHQTPVMSVLIHAKKLAHT